MNSFSIILSVLFVFLLCGLFFFSSSSQRFFLGFSVVQIIFSAFLLSFFSTPVLAGFFTFLVFLLIAILSYYFLFKRFVPNYYYHRFDYFFVACLTFLSILIVFFITRLNLTISQKLVSLYFASMLFIILSVYQRSIFRIIYLISIKSTNNREARDLAIIFMIISTLGIYIVLTINKCLSIDQEQMDKLVNWFAYFNYIANDVFATYILFYTLMSECEKFIDKKKINVKIDNSNVIFRFGKVFINEDNRILLPIQLFDKGIGAILNYSDNNETVEIIKDNIVIKINVDSKIANVNGKEIEMHTKSQIINSVFYVPVRFICEQIGMTVYWEEKKRTLNINNKKTISINRKQEVDCSLGSHG